MPKKKSKYIYRYTCEVHGYWDGEVKAKNKSEAKIKANECIDFEGLIITGDINIERYTTGAYNYDCEVHGHWDGEVKADNKPEAIVKIKDELGMESLYPCAEIHIEREKNDDR